MKPSSPVLAAVSAAVLLGVGLLVAQIQAATPPPATAVHTFQPKIPRGTPVAGNCWTTSIATNRSDAYRCMAGNAISDPCFATSKPTIVVCDPDPTKHKRGFAMSVKGPLPPSPSAPGRVLPWLIELTDGTTCSPLTGTRPFIGKLVVGYGCSTTRPQPTGTYVGLADTLDTRHALWYARRVSYRAGLAGTELVASSRVPVAAAWR